MRREIVNHSALMHPHISTISEVGSLAGSSCGSKLCGAHLLQRHALLDTWLHGLQVCGDGGAAASNLALTAV